MSEFDEMDQEQGSPLQDVNDTLSKARDIKSKADNAKQYAEKAKELAAQSRNAAQAANTVKTASTNAKNVGEAVKTSKSAASSLGSAAKGSGGNVYVFIAQMIKEFIKDPEGMTKLVGYALVAVLVPLLLIIGVLFLFTFGLIMVVANLIMSAYAWLIENSDSSGDILEDITIGYFVRAPRNWLNEQLEDYFSEEQKAEIEGKVEVEVGLNGETENVGVEQNLDDEMKFASDARTADRLLLKRLRMVKNSIESRLKQYKSHIAITGTIEAWAQALWHEPWLTINGDITATYDFPEITDLDAVKLMAAYTMQKNLRFEDINTVDLRWWLGKYISIIADPTITIGGNRVYWFSDEIPADPAQGKKFDVQTYDGGGLPEVETTDLALAFFLPHWFGTFVPQYEYEEFNQFQRIYKSVQDGYYQGSDDEKSKIIACGLSGSYIPTAVTGIIDDYIYVSNASLMVSKQTHWYKTTDVIDLPRHSYYLLSDEEYQELLEDYKRNHVQHHTEEITPESLPENWQEINEEEWVRTDENNPDHYERISYYSEERKHGEINITVATRDVYSLATDIIGFWKGDLTEYDESTGLNRPYSSTAKDKNILMHEWEGTAGLTYHRTTPHEYEGFIDIIKSSADEAYPGVYDKELKRLDAIAGLGTGNGSTMAEIAVAMYEEWDGRSNPGRYFAQDICGWSYTPEWCCLFVYGCGVLGGFVGEDKCMGKKCYAYSGDSFAYFDERDRATRSPSYIPQPGDLIYYKDDGESMMQHIGIVICANDDGTLDTVEGNMGNQDNSLSKVSYCHWKTYNAGGYIYGGRYIYGYASPDYPEQAIKDISSIKVYYTAAGASDLTHQNYLGYTSYGTTSCTADRCKTILTDMENSMPDVGQSLYNYQPGSEAFGTEWNKVVRADTNKAFREAFLTAYYKRYVQPMIEDVNESLHVNLLSDRALIELAWCAVTRNGAMAAVTHFKNADVSSSMSAAEVVDAYYRYMQANVETFYRQYGETAVNRVKTILQTEQRLLTNMLANP